MSGFPPKESPPKEGPPKEGATPISMSTTSPTSTLQKVAIHGPAGFLEGLLQERSQPSSAIGIVCHPHPFYGGTMHNKVVFRAAAALQEAGLDVLRFNFRGVGESTGTYDGGNGEMEDARAVIEYVTQHHSGLPIVLAGFSFGAGVALRVGALDSRVTAMIAIAPPVAEEVFAGLEECRTPKLFVHGTDDRLHSIDAFRAIYERVSPPKEAVVVEGANHFFDGRLQALTTAITKFAREVAPAKATDGES